MLRTIGIGLVGCLMSCLCGAQQMSTVCKFTHGPASGTTHDYAPLSPAPVGTACNDGKGSTGSVIPKPADNPSPTPAPTQEAAANSAPANSQSGQQVSTICSFNRGPAAGTTHDYAPLDPLPVGTTCNDGKGSAGTIIARSEAPKPETNPTGSQQMSTVCSFNHGPAAGTTHDYAPLDPLPVGTICNDGKGSTGAIIAKSEDVKPETNPAGGQEMSTLCRFTRGPVAGSTHDYAPLDPLPVGTECNNGAGSIGVIIARPTSAPPANNMPSYGGPGNVPTNNSSSESAAPSYAGMGSQQMSTVCKFNNGPAAGTMHDYAPLEPIAVGSACNDGKGSTGTIIPRSQ